MPSHTEHHTSEVLYVMEKRIFSHVDNERRSTFKTLPPTPEVHWKNVYRRFSANLTPFYKYSKFEIISTRIIWRKGWIEEWTLGRMDALKNEWSSGSHHTKPLCPPKLDVLANFLSLHIIHAAKWQKRHSSTSLKQQRRPLPSLLSVSSSILIGKTIWRLKNLVASSL